MPIITISDGHQLFELDNLAVLSPDRSTRLHFLDRAAIDVNLPKTAREIWRNVLCERALNDEEVEEFRDDVADTPVSIERRIGGEFADRTVKVSVPSLVPCSRRYYERLIGAYDGSTSIRAYASGEGRRFFEQLFAWRPYDGFLLSLLLSSHSALTIETSVEHMESEDLVRAFSFLVESGDRISQLGAIEVGIRVLSERPEIQPALMRLTEQIRDDDVDGLTSAFKLLSALFLLVDGELSRTRLLSEHPPFYRRLAALAQAALICRQTMDLGEATDSFCEWAASSGGGRHYSQSLADMRLEPRWYPNYSEVSQIKANFCGRIVIASSDYEENIRGNEIHDLVLGAGPESIVSHSKINERYLPGPLEGTVDSLHKMPPELSETIQAQLREEEVKISSFAALLNSAPIFGIELNQAGLVAKVRDLGNILLASVEGRDHLQSILFGLALVAAITRNVALAEELRSLVRKCRQDVQYPLSVEDALTISLVAAASREGLNDWVQFVGACLTELAFGELEDREREALQIHLQYLCHAVPELWASCNRADAALKALRGY